MPYMAMSCESLLTISLAVIGTIIVLYAQAKINNAYSKYKKINNKKNITGQEVARKILDSNGLDNVHVVEVSGTLTDHYDPSRKVVRLSKDIFNGNSLAALSVAAHECGHAIQDKEGYGYMRIRSMLVPVVNFISYAGYFVLIITLIAGMTGYLIYGLLLVLASLLFQIVTLPVEFDASKRAKNQVLALGLIDNNEKQGVHSVLNAAAMTYVASVISAIINLIRLILMYGNRNKD